MRESVLHKLCWLLNTFLWPLSCGRNFCESVAECFDITKPNILRANRHSSSAEWANTCSLAEVVCRKFGPSAILPEYQWSLQLCFLLESYTNEFWPDSATVALLQEERKLCIYYENQTELNICNIIEEMILSIQQTKSHPAAYHAQRTWVSWNDDICSGIAESTQLYTRTTCNKY